MIDIRDKCVIMTSKRVNCDTCTYTQIQKPRPMDKCYLTCAIDFTNTQLSELLRLLNIGCGATVMVGGVAFRYGDDSSLCLLNVVKVICQ